MRRSFRLSRSVAVAVAAITLAHGATVFSIHEAGAAPARRTRAASRAAADPSKQIIARIAGGTITRGDFDARMAELPPQYRAQFSTPEGKRRFLERMIEERVWLESARKAGVDKRPDVVKRLEDQRRDLLIRTYLGEVQANAPGPTDTAIAGYYESHPEEFRTEEQVKVRHIQVADEKKARDVKKRLERGADFVAVAKEVSTDAMTKDRGGELGYASRGGPFGSLGRQPALAESAFAGSVNAIRGPYQTTAGWHLIQVTERKPAAARPLEEVRPLIARQLTQSANMAYYQDQLAEHRKRLSVRVDSAAIESLTASRQTAAELFREAGELPGPDERIAAYTRLVSLHPESEYAPQALFMVGFVESEEKRDYDKAEAAFRDLLTKYPRSELVQSAQWMIDNMRSDKTPEFELPGGLGSASERDSPENRPETATPDKP